MRPTPTLLVLALTTALFTWPAVVCAGEAAPPQAAPPKAVPPQAVPQKKRAAPRRGAPAADAKAAAEIGRGLLSTDERVRREAVGRLLARITKGGDLAAFLDAMSRANRAWADRHERLMEAWLDDAVHGNARARERAVRLLTALGEKAIRRLAIELRHARMHGGTGIDAGEPDEDARPAAGSEPVRQEAGVGIPRVYELADLFQRGMNPVELRGLLQKKADAVEVKQFKTLFVVTALDTGHKRLGNYLHALRVGYRLDEKSAQEEDALESAQKDDASGQQAAGDNVEGARDEPAVAAPQGAPPPPAARPQTTAGEVALHGPRAAARGAAGTWRLEPTLFHLPRTTLSALVVAQGSSPAQRLLPRGLIQGERHVLRTQDFERAVAWTKALRRIPDSRTGLPLRGASRVAAGGKVQLFAGKQIHYSKSVRRTKGGAWTIVTGTIPHGIAVEVALHAVDTTLRVDVVATRSDVGLPIPVVRVQPSPKAAPVELEQPEWSTTTVRRSYDMPLQGGGALLSLDGLGSSPEDHLVLALTLSKPVSK